MADNVTLPTPHGSYLISKENEDGEYSDTFEEYSSDDGDKGEQLPNEIYRDVDLGMGILLKVPIGKPDITCKVEPLCAEERTERLDDINPPEDAFLVSDIYSFYSEELPPPDTDPPYKIQLQLDLPHTNLDKRNLFLFTVCKRKSDWEIEQAEYQKSCVQFTLEKMEYFVVYANPSSEYKGIGRKGGTFRSKKDDRISVQIHENTLQNPVDICFKITPTTDRLASYKKYKPDIFEGIYAFTDILSVQHASQVKFQKKATVHLPMDTRIPEDSEVHALHIEKEGIDVRDERPEICDDGTVKIPHDVTGTSSCQAVSTRPGISKDTVKKYAMFQSKQLNFVKILAFISDKYSPPGSRRLTIQVVEAPTAKQVVKDRLKEGFHEIKKSRSKMVEIMKDDRVRVTTTGNIQLMGKLKSLSFKFMPSCKENCISFNMKRVGFMSGLPFAVVTIQTGVGSSHVIHFYCDYIPMTATTNLNKQTLSLVKDAIKRNVVENTTETVSTKQTSKKDHLDVKLQKDTKEDILKSKPNQTNNGSVQIRPKTTTGKNFGEMANVPRLHLDDRETSLHQRENTCTTLRDANPGLTPSSDRTIPTNRSSGYCTGTTNSRISLTSDRSLSTDSSQPSDGNVSSEKHPRQRNISCSDQTDGNPGVSDTRSTKSLKGQSQNKELQNPGFHSSRCKTAKTPRPVLRASESIHHQHQPALSHIDNPNKSGKKSTNTASRSAAQPLLSADAYQVSQANRLGTDVRHFGFSKDEHTTKPQERPRPHISEESGSLSQIPEDSDLRKDVLFDEGCSKLPQSRPFDVSLQRQQTFTSVYRLDSYFRRHPNQLSLLNVEPIQQFDKPAQPVSAASPRGLQGSPAQLPQLPGDRSGDTNVLKHPMFSEISLHILADNIPVNERQQILLSLDVSHDKQVKVIEEARDSDTDPTFLLLKKWYQGLMKQDQGVIAHKLENALDENERADLAVVVQTVYTEGRAFRRDDFRS